MRKKGLTGSGLKSLYCFMLVLLLEAFICGCCSRKEAEKISEDRQFRIAGVRIGATKKTAFLKENPFAAPGSPKKSCETFTCPVDITIEDIRFNLMGLTFKNDVLVEVTLFSRLPAAGFDEKVDEILNRLDRRYEILRRDYNTGETIFQPRKNVYPCFTPLKKDEVIALSFVEMAYFGERGN